jgi:hypothetical protein
MTSLHLIEQSLNKEIEVLLLKKEVIYSRIFEALNIPEDP